MKDQRPGAASARTSLDPQQNYEMLQTEMERIQEKATIVERQAEDQRMEELRLAKQRTNAVDETERLKVEIEQLQRQLADRDQNIKSLKSELEELEHETATLEHSIEVKREQLGKADQIEMWRMRRMLRRLEIKRQMRDKWKAEAEKIATKARQVEMEEMAALAAEAKAKDAIIKRQCDVYAMVPVLAPGTSSAFRSTDTTTTTRTQSVAIGSVASKGVTPAAESSNYGTDWDPAHDIRKYGQPRVSGASASVRLTGDSISTLASHTNPEVRAAARRVQAMYHD